MPPAKPPQPSHEDILDEKCDELTRLIRSNIDNRSGYAEDHVKSRTLQKIFQQFDIDHTGYMSYEEFAKVLSHLNIAADDEAVSALFDRYDLNESGTLTFKEFSDAVFNMAPAPLSDPRTREVLKAFKRRLLERGSDNVNGLTRSMRIMDRNKDLYLRKEELFNGLQKYRVPCTLQEVDVVIKAFDRSGDGEISIEEFLRGLRGRMPRRRRQLVMMAYRILDRDGNESVTLSELAEAYDVSQHPQVLSGQLSPDEVLRTFAASWDKNGDDNITWGEFLDYYKGLSAGIDNDDYFELMIRNCWHISGGDGSAQNTSCRRVLVHHRDGFQTIEEIKNDLGIRADDVQLMRQRLEEQGIDDIVKIELYS